MSKKFTIEYIRKIFKDNGCVLLSNNYISTKEKLYYICDCGRKDFKSFDAFKRGQRCNECKKEKLRDLKKLDFNFVKSVFESEDYTLISDRYTNSKQKLKVLCPKGHKDEISFGHFHYDGARCNECYLDNWNGENHPNWKGGITPISIYLRRIITEWVQESFKSNNYKCVITNENADVIHHLYNFNKILKETLEICKLEIKDVSEYKDDELIKLEKTCLELHYKYGLGVPLKSSVHNEFHRIYGKKDNNAFQFQEFKDNYVNLEVC